MAVAVCWVVRSISDPITARERWSLGECPPNGIDKKVTAAVRLPPQRIEAVSEDPDRRWRRPVRWAPDCPNRGCHVVADLRVDRSIEGCLQTSAGPLDAAHAATSMGRTTAAISAARSAMDTSPVTRASLSASDGL